jgi:16S rRNA (guanine527-N7)-methyltransferase
LSALEDRYRAALLTGAKTLGIDVGDTLADAMTAHYALVVKWGSRINLTSVTDPEEAASLHGIDSLLFLEPLAKRTGSCVDVGSGAGFPGLILALARPDLKITLLEPRRKRASFLRVALAELSRADVGVVEGKLEERSAGVTPPFPADLVLSRATIPPLDLIERSGGRVSPGGLLIITSGAGAPEPPAIASAAKQAGLRHETRVLRTLPTGETRILDVLSA